MSTFENLVANLDYASGWYKNFILYMYTYLKLVDVLDVLDVYGPDFRELSIKITTKAYMKT